MAGIMSAEQIARLDDAIKRSIIAGYMEQQDNGWFGLTPKGIEHHRINIARNRAGMVLREAKRK